ncbi:MerR family transcriptional regulator [Saccharospirillum salsuginis]|uniref:HTH merR-type domain-containing protein n=1 Tax=Saccharospirillum salsuginis TaxID=418750 RepID=A0A918KPY0_9GAMM|nr:MerR family transcriptional regulator [Saccharospirillum salsuginis]GGX71379.1 hypothetical protein GCM10007392_43600 [Saccharospirillum salsuginis]
MTGNEFDNKYQQFLQKVKVGIHEASDITGVPTRKIRYWQDKGYIESTPDSGNTRQYDLFNVKKIVLIQELIEDGHTLDGAATKVNRRIEKLNKMFDLVLPTKDPS